MITQNLLLFMFFSLFPQICYCQNPHVCSVSSCGDIRNISFPFRLKTDPKHCGDYELSCENSVTTILYLNSHKYRVKAIDYIDQTILVADVSVKNNTCSIPQVSINEYFLRDYSYKLYLGRSISFMRCPYPLKAFTPTFIEFPSHCAASDSSTYTYITLDLLKVLYVRDNCSIDLIAWTSWNFMDLGNVTVSEIHDSLLYGFQLAWGSPLNHCAMCYGRIKCGVNIGDVVTCSHSVGAKLEVLWVVVFAGVTLPAKIILGFASASAFIIIEWNIQRVINILWHVQHLPTIIVLFFAVRFIIVFPFVIWFLIYKFRRSRLSRFAAIEEFLQSDNNLMPIRYSYSDIKKMARGFREKLGQGGYGTVYKGKLRSGYDVAIKLLKTSGGIGQDFMNEIATIGRIHHVNVVKLVGYCAEGSKRALVFDYMPNCSLDKYLYNRENTIFLSWERKHEIAVGVARGIEYLHKGCDIQILHFDIKPHNILLDDNFTPKITDFGLAKFFSTDKKVVTMTAIRGTIGYVAPELINRGFGEVSFKADVYSFGMLLMEMIGLNKDMKRSNQTSSLYFPCWIYDFFEQGHDIGIEVIDENNDDDNNDSNREIVKKMTIVALWCIQMSPTDRPSMNKVVEMLEGQVERLRIPNRRPSESAPIGQNYEDQSSTTYSTDSIPLLPNNAALSIEITVED